MLTEEEKRGYRHKTLCYLLSSQFCPICDKQRQTPIPVFGVRLSTSLSCLSCISISPFPGKCYFMASLLFIETVDAHEIESLHQDFEKKDNNGLSEFMRFRSHIWYITEDLNH